MSSSASFSKSHSVFAAPPVCVCLFAFALAEQNGR